MSTTGKPDDVLYFFYSCIRELWAQITETKNFFLDLLFLKMMKIFDGRDLVCLDVTGDWQNHLDRNEKINK